MKLEELFYNLQDTLSNSVKRYISEGGNINSQQPHTGWNALYLAVEHQELELIEYLVSHGANLELRSKGDGWTALHHAVDIDCDGANQMGEELTMETVACLLRLGADPDARTNNNQTPRDIAADYGSHALELYDSILGRAANAANQ